MFCVFRGVYKSSVLLPWRARTSLQPVIATEARLLIDRAETIVRGGELRESHQGRERS